MCEPVTIATGLMIASGAMQYQQARKDSKFMQGQLGEESRINAEATADQISQIQSQAAIDMSERTKAGLQERARLRVAAGEFGVGGVSPGISEKRSLFAEGFDLSTMDNNRKAAQKQAGLEGRTAQNRTTTERYRNAPPNLWTSALTIGANVAGLRAGRPSRPKLPGTSKYDDGPGGYD
jgi:hypothetical protein